MTIDFIKKTAYGIAGLVAAAFLYSSPVKAEEVTPQPVRPKPIEKNVVSFPGLGREIDAKENSKYDLGLGDTLETLIVVKQGEKYGFVYYYSDIYGPVVSYKTKEEFDKFYKKVEEKYIALEPKVKKEEAKIDDENIKRFLENRYGKQEEKPETPEYFKDYWTRGFIGDEYVRNYELSAHYKKGSAPDYDFESNEYNFKLLQPNKPGLVLKFNKLKEDFDLGSHYTQESYGYSLIGTYNFGLGRSSKIAVGAGITSEFSKGRDENGEILNKYEAVAMPTIYIDWEEEDFGYLRLTAAWGDGDYDIISGSSGRYEKLAIELDGEMEAENKKGYWGYKGKYVKSKEEGEDTTEFFYDRVYCGARKLNNVIDGAEIGGGYEGYINPDTGMLWFIDAKISKNIGRNIKLELGGRIQQDSDFVFGDGNCWFFNINASF